MLVRYLNLLPHVAYRDVGINFTFSSVCHLPNPFEGIIRDGDWMTTDGGVTDASVELRYRMEQPLLTVKIDIPKSAAVDRANPDRQIVYRVNYHHFFGPNDHKGREEYILGTGLLKKRFIEYAACLPFKDREIL